MLRDVEMCDTLFWRQPQKCAHGQSDGGDIMSPCAVNGYGVVANALSVRLARGHFNDSAGIDTSCGDCSLGGEHLGRGSDRKR